jgi:hypothetical protein
MVCSNPHEGSFTNVLKLGASNRLTSPRKLRNKTGLVYLNAGVTLIADRKELATPDDLKGRKVAVFSPAQAEPFAKIGSVPVFSRTGDAKALWIQLQSVRLILLAGYSPIAGSGQLGAPVMKSADARLRLPANSVR